VLYTLVDDHLELIRSYTMYPLKPRGKGQKRYRDHDYHSNEAITYAILHGRQQQVRMSGLFLFYEYFLNPPHRRPCSDALVIVHTREKGYASHNLVHVPEKRPAYFWYHMHHGGTTIQGERLMMVGRHPQAIPIAAADEKMGNFQESVLVPWTRYAGTSDEGRTLWDTTCGHFQKRSFLATITGFVLFRFTSEFQTFTDRRGYGEFARVEVTGSGGTGRVPRDPRG
jgi:hypothetical protein